VDQQRRWILFIVLTGLLYAVFYFVVVIPYQKKLEDYRKAHAPLSAPDDSATSPSLAITTDTIALAPGAEPTSPALAAEEAATSPPADTGPAEQVVVATGLYRVTLSSRGGRPTSWVYYNRLPGRKDVEAVEMIPEHAETLQQEFPLELLIKESNRVPYPELNTSIHDVQVLPQDDGSTRVVFTSPVVAKMRLVKTFTFRPNDHLTDLQLVLQNLDEKTPIRISDADRGVGITWGPGVRRFARDESYDMNLIRSVYGTPRGVYSAHPTDPTADIVSYTGEIEWAGLTDKFFLAAVIPRGTAKAVALDQLVRLKNLPPNEKKAQNAFSVILYSDDFTLPPQSQMALAYELFVGPKRPPLLAKISERTEANLHALVFYDSWFSWMRWLKIGLMKSLNWLYNLVGNYGIAIILLTILIRLLTHPLAHKGMKIQAKTMAEMQRIKPALDALNVKYKNDAAKRNQEMMKLYKEHNISPLAPLRGCLPMLVQIPIFFALYSLLNQAIDLRGASFLWIDDLSAPDRLVDLARYGMDFAVPFFNWHVAAINLLPILMGASQFFVSKLTPTPSRDPAQKQMMLIFSLLFPVMLYNFPSGLFIYWLINNVWQSVHQLIANRSVKPAGGEAAAARA